MSLFELQKQRICLEPNTTFGHSMSTPVSGSQGGWASRVRQPLENGDTNTHSPEMSILWSFGGSRDAIVALAPLKFHLFLFFTNYRKTTIVIVYKS